MPANVHERSWPIPTTDAIIEYSNGVKDGIILITRKNKPFGYALPGGFAEKGLSFEENVAKEVAEETGLEIRIKNPNRPYVFSNPVRDPREHITANVYIVQGSGKLQAGDDAETAHLFTLDEVAKMLHTETWAFDHKMIVESYITKWRSEYDSR